MSIMRLHKNDWQKYMRKLRNGLRLLSRRAQRWWRKQDRRFGWVWRVGNGLAALLIVVSLALPVLNELGQRNAYKLSAQTLDLVGQTDQKLTKQLTYDPAKQLYQFNKDAVKNSYDPTAAIKNQVGAASGGKDKSLYALDVPQDLSQGVTYHDTNSQLSFGLKPEFKSSEGQVVDGHLVYPLGGGTQAIYTLKNNGLKEDIVVPEVSSDTMRFSYQLDLPDTLQAKVIPDSGGAIGIYSADPSLFGNISYGSDADQAAVQKARENGDKTYLVFGLPAPVIKAPDGASIGNASARFELNGNQLTVVAENLSDVKTPITIDPSVVVSSASEFQANGNNEGMIDFDTTNNRINRSGLTGGSVGSYSAGTGIPTGLYGGASVVYNSYLYFIGGATGTTPFNFVQYVPINADGSLGTWAPGGATSINTARWGHTAFAYNGYMYVIGGTTGSSILNDVQYAPINANGTLGTWSTTTNLPSSRYYHTAAVYNGNVYIMGGCSTGALSCTAYLNDVQYAPINANGTIGSWTSTTPFTTARRSHTSVQYNGYLYVIGGYSGSVQSDVQYAAINSDGTVGTWMTTTSMLAGRYAFGATVYNGYLYTAGGFDTTDHNDTQYTPINANGSLGSWQSTSTFSLIRDTFPMVANNGYIYILGGSGGSNPAASIQYAKIDPAGQTQAWTTDSTHTISAARALVCSVAYNGYLYTLGGSTSDDSKNNVATVQYAALNADGTIGAWTTSAHSLPTTRGSGGCAAANGYIYYVGGWTGPSTVVSQDGVVYYDTIAASGDVGNTWNSTSGTTTANAAYFSVYNTSFIYNGYIYSLGDTQGSNTLYAPINSNGSLGSWSVGNTLVANSYGSRAYARVGKYLYAIGGQSGGGTQTNRTEYALINSNGSDNGWSETGMGTLPANMAYAHATTVNGCIYLVGSENTSGVSQNPVYYGCPSANGTIATWNTAPSLVTATTDMGVASYNGFIYGVGGWATAATGNVEYTAVNDGGSGALGAFADSGHNFSCARNSLSSVAYNGYLYVAGGRCSNVPQNDIQYAQINSNGSLGVFTTDTHTFTKGRYFFGLVAYNGYMYIVAGAKNDTPACATINGSLSYCNDVQYAPIGSNGALTASFTTNSTTIDTKGREGPCTFAYNGYMYVLGGWDGTSDLATTRYAPINSDGSIGSWTSGTSFSGGRSNLACTVANGYLYILGGDGSVKYNDVQSAQINSNGSLGSWSTTSSFTNGRSDSVVGVSNGFIYIMGGINQGNQTLGDTQFAPINTNGTLGEWQQTINVMNQPRNEAGGAMYNGYIYESGGNENSGDATDTEYAPINAISRIGRYSKLIDLGVPTNITSISYNYSGIPPINSAARGTSPISYKAAGSNGVFGSLTNGSTISAATCKAGTQNYTRYLLVTITLDDSDGGGSGIFSDTSGTPTNVTDFTVNYNPVHPLPAIRLRMGQTLQNGNVSALDTCTP